jgi:hypothetical protein
MAAPQTQSHLLCSAKGECIMKTSLMLIVLLLLTLLVTACQPQGMPVPQDPLEAVDHSRETEGSEPATT